MKGTARVKEGGLLSQNLRDGEREKALWHLLGKGRDHRNIIGGGCGSNKGAIITRRAAIMELEKGKGMNFSF